MTSDDAARRAKAELRKAKMEWLEYRRAEASAETDQAQWLSWINKPRRVQSGGDSTD